MALPLAALLPFALPCCDGQGGPDRYSRPSCRIVSVHVEDHTTYQLAHPVFPTLTGDLWPCAWGEGESLYVANGDGFGFGPVWSDIVFSIVTGDPPHLSAATPRRAYGPHIAGVWGPESLKVNRKPTGLTCVDGALYLFFQNLKNALSEDPFGDAPHASISVSRDSGLSWEYDHERPMFTDHVFTTGFFLDYGQCQRHAQDEYVYVYGLDYNWRFSDTFSQTKLYLARVERDRILARGAWEFFSGNVGQAPLWSADIADKVPVLEDPTLYRDKRSGISQGSVVYIPQIARYLYSTRAEYEWIFYEAAAPWGPWTKVSVIEWKPRATEDFHGGYPVVIPSKFLDGNGTGGWLISSLSISTLGGRFYNMSMRRFELEIERNMPE